MIAIQIANTSLIQLMAFSNAALTTRRNECLPVKNTIQITQEMKAIAAIVAARKEHQSWERSIMKGKYILTGRDLLDSILETENATKENEQTRIKRKSKSDGGDTSALVNERERN